MENRSNFCLLLGKKEKSTCRSNSCTEFGWKTRRIRWSKKCRFPTHWTPYQRLVHCVGVHNSILHTRAHRFNKHISIQIIICVLCNQVSGHKHDIISWAICDREWIPFLFTAKWVRSTTRFHFGRAISSFLDFRPSNKYLFCNSASSFWVAQSVLFFSFSSHCVHDPSGNIPFSMALMHTHTHKILSIFRCDGH